MSTTTLILFAGKTKSGEEDEDVSGTITIPEVAHDTAEDEYVVCSLGLPHPRYHPSFLVC